MKELEITADLEAEKSLVDRYHKARKEWDDRLGGARVQAANWRYATFFSLLLLAFAITGMVYLGTLPKEVLHIVEVDKLGRAQYVGRAGVSFDKYQHSDDSKRFHLERFIRDVRALSSDVVVIKQNWDDAYKLVTPSGANILSEYANRYVPTERVKEERVTVEDVSVIPISKDSWSVEWNEIYWSTTGVRKDSGIWKGVFNLVYQKPESEKQARLNPIGMYIDSFSWSQASD